MADTNKTIAELLDGLPPAEEVRRQIAENSKQGKLLKKALRLAEARDDVQSLALNNAKAPSSPNKRQP